MLSARKRAVTEVETFMHTNRGQLPICAGSRRQARFWLLAIICFAISLPALAQEAGPAKAKADPAESDRQFDEAMRDRADVKPALPGADESEQAVPGIDLLEMASPEVGGIFMYPIYFFSFVVVLFAIERTLALRRRKVVPRELIESFGDLANAQPGFDPRKAYRLCQQYPSTASNVIRAVLLKIGRPHSEVEQSVVMANEREAAKLYTNIRPLNLAASAAPLLGLLGTVQGMIMAFYATAHLPDGANKAQFLAQGVYVALITTFAGLCVAIPAVCVAHYLEGTIQKRFREIDELIYNLLPQLERYEGKLRVSRHGGPEAVGSGDPKAPEKPRTTSLASE